MSLAARTLSLSLLAAAALLCSACGSSSSTSSSSTSTDSAGGASLRGTTITLYSGQHEQTTAKLVQAFEQESGVKVLIRSDDEAALGNQIIQEGSHSPADAFYTENTPVLEALHAKGLLAPVDRSTLSAVPKRYDSANGDWVGVSARESALVYNTSKVKESELPSSILELAEPKWKGKLGFAPSETDFQPVVTSIIKADGIAKAEQFLEGLKANAKIYPDNETVVAQVNNGQADAGPINHYYWFRLRDEVGASGLHSALHYYAAGDPGDLVNISGAAVLESSSHQAAAQALLAFLVSHSGQETLAHSQSYEYPLRPGVAPAAGLRPFDELRPVTLTPAELGDGSQALELEQKLGLL